MATVLQPGPSNPARVANPRAESNSEQNAILGCLQGVQRRLWLVRITERMAIGLIWAGAIGAVLTAAWLVRQRFFWATGLIALLPVLAAVWLWFRASRKPSGLLPKGLLRAAAVVTVAVVLATLALAWMGVALPTWNISVAIAAVFLIGSAASVRPIDSRSAAIFIDQQVGLRERVATALELLGSPAQNPLEAAFRDPVIESALSACESVRGAKVNYARIDRRVYALAVVAVIAAGGVSLLSPLPARAQPVRRFTTVVQQAAKLADVIKELEEKKLPKDDVTPEKLQPLQNALAQLKKGEMSPFEASAKLNEIKADMQRGLDDQEAADKVEKALESLKATEDFAKAGDEAKQANVKAASGDQGAAGQQKAAAQAMQAAAKSVGDQLGNMSADQKKDLANSLKDAAKQAGGNAQLQKNLEDAAQAAAQDNAEKLSQNLQAAGEQMARERTERQLSAQAVRDAMDQIDRMQSNGMSAGEQQAQNGDQGQSGQSGGKDGNKGGEQQSAGNQGDQGQNGQGEGANKDGQQGQGDQAGAGAQQANGNSGQGQQGGEQESNGSTNFHQLGAPGDHDAGHPLGKQGTYVHIYDQTEIKSQGKTEKLQSQINPLGAAAGKAEVMGVGDKTDPAIKSYDSEFSSARQRVMDDLQTQQIPPKYQELIREYYK